MTTEATVCEVCDGPRDDNNELGTRMVSIVDDQKIGVCWGCWEDFLPPPPKCRTVHDV